MEAMKRSAKEIRVAPIGRSEANLFVKHWHYSGSVMQSSSLHLGAFLDDRLHGVMQFGSCIDKRKIQPMVEGTHWNGFLELNRMAFDDHLPKNSESRALSVAFRLIKKNYPHIKWVISFADACQCGDGTIYRASGFDLIGVKKNKTMMRLPDGTIVADKTLNSNAVHTAHWWRKRGATELPGFQIRYIYFIDKSMRSKLTVPILPYSAIEEAGASMYLGKAREVGNDPAPPGTAAVQR
jgi:hypothetical protein